MDIKDKLSAAIEQAAKDAIADGVFPEGELPKIVLEVPPQKEFGDFATNFAMQSDAYSARIRVRLPKNWQSGLRAIGLTTRRLPALDS